MHTNIRRTLVQVVPIQCTCNAWQATTRWQILDKTLLSYLQFQKKTDSSRVRCSLFWHFSLTSDTVITLSIIHKEQSYCGHFHQSRSVHDLLQGYIKCHCTKVNNAIISMKIKHGFRITWTKGECSFKNIKYGIIHRIHTSDQLID